MLLGRTSRFLNGHTAKNVTLKTPLPYQYKQSLRSAQHKFWGCEELDLFSGIDQQVFVSPK